MRRIVFATNNDHKLYEIKKALNEKLVANNKFQEAIGVKSKEGFAQRMADPLNQGIESFDLMSIIEFDNTQMEIRKPKPGDIDYHPSFALLYCLR